MLCYDHCVNPRDPEMCGMDKGLLRGNSYWWPEFIHSVLKSSEPQCCAEVFGHPLAMTGHLAGWLHKAHLHTGIPPSLLNVNHCTYPSRHWIPCGNPDDASSIWACSLSWLLIMSSPLYLFSSYIASFLSDLLKKTVVWNLTFPPTVTALKVQCPELNTMF